MWFSATSADSAEEAMHLRHIQCVLGHGLHAFGFLGHGVWGWYFVPDIVPSLLKDHRALVSFSFKVLGGLSVVRWISVLRCFRVCLWFVGSLGFFCGPLDLGFVCGSCNKRTPFKERRDLSRAILSRKKCFQSRCAEVNSPTNSSTYPSLLLI